MTSEISESVGGRGRGDPIPPVTYVVCHVMLHTQTYPGVMTANAAVVGQGLLLVNEAL